MRTAHTARVLPERPVLGGHRLGLVLSECLVAARLGVDQHRVLHTRLLWGSLIILETNGRRRRGQRRNLLAAASCGPARIPDVCAASAEGARGKDEARRRARSSAAAGMQS